MYFLNQTLKLLRNYQIHNNQKDETVTVKDSRGSIITDYCILRPGSRDYLYNTELNKAHVKLENRNLKDTINLNDVSFTIPFVGWDQEEKSEAGLRFNLAKEGFLEAEININPVSGEYDGSLMLYHLYLESLQKYIASYADIGLFKE